jgi:NADH-ubiquinone oxidoreductase chain 1
MELGILFMLAVSSLATYGILLAGWSANSKYAFLGSLRSTAQLISYELVLSSVLLIIVMITNSLNLNINVQFQKIVWLALPLFCILIIFFIGSVAETNRAPFDLAEAIYLDLASLKITNCWKVLIKKISRNSTL